MAKPATRYFAARSYSLNQRGVPSVEAPLQEAAAASARVLAPSDCRQLLVIPELEVHGVRPDLWIGCVDERSFLKRARLGIEPCTAPLPLSIAVEIRRRGGAMTIDRLAPPNGPLGDRSRVLRGVADLVERGLVVREEGDVRLAPGWASARAEGVAIETKIGQWRRALRQVQMWRRFVNGAWMVFPASYLPAVPRQRPGTRAIGLATVDGESLEVIRRPRLTVGQPFPKAVLEEHLYLRWLAEGFDKRSSHRKRSPARSRDRAAIS
jgi:hypothetical protein